MKNGPQSNSPRAVAAGLSPHRFMMLTLVVMHAKPSIDKMGDAFARRLFDDACFAVGF